MKREVVISHYAYPLIMWTWGRAFLNEQVMVVVARPRIISCLPFSLLPLLLSSSPPRNLETFAARVPTFRITNTSKILISQ
jgi:hypothetical protein